MKLNKIFEWTDRNLHHIILSALSIFSIIFLFLPFILHNHLNERDLTGHIFSSWYIKEYLFPNVSGWNPMHMLGFPQGEMYPFLVHYIVACAGFIMDIKIAFKLLVTITGLSIPYTVYFFSAVLFKSRNIKLIFTLFIYALLLILPGYMGFDIKSVFSPGLATSFISIPLVFWYLGLLFKEKPHSFKLTIILSVIVLTHIVSSLVMIIITFIYIFFNYKSDKFKKLLLILVFTFLITSFYTLPFIAFRKYTLSPKTDPISMTYFGGIILLSLLVIGGSFISKSKKIIIAPAFIIIMSTLFIFANSLDSLAFLLDLHPYRFFSYMVVALFILIFFISYSAVFRRIKRLKYIGMLCVFISLLITTGIFLVKDFDVKGRKDIDINLDQYEGLIAANYRTADIIDQTRMPYYQPLYINDGVRFTTGQFEESSFNAPYMWSLSKGFIDDENQTQVFIEDIRFGEEDLLAADKFFGVNYSINTGEYKCKDTPQIQVSEFETSCLVDNLLDNNCKKDLYVCKLSDASTFEVWDRDIVPVLSNWNNEVEQWWRDARFKNELLVEGEYFGKEKAANARVDLVSNSDTWDRFSIRISTNTDVPVLVRMSYFPKWKAYKDGREIPISRVSPNLMLISSYGDIEFKYEETSIEKISTYISIAGLILFLAIIVLRKRFNWNF